MTTPEPGGTPGTPATDAQKRYDEVLAAAPRHSHRSFADRDACESCIAVVRAGRAVVADGPVTEAGRRLVDHYDGVLRFAPDILAIEAEAARSERERLREALGVMQGRFVPANGYPGDHHGVYWVDIDAVLALIDPDRRP